MVNKEKYDQKKLKNQHYKKKLIEKDKKTKLIEIIFTLSLSKV